ncbi:MAG: hypothetical protein P4L67_02335 [Candidatus Pacebacteria bacterium]|nr:hypothetical protein [Candidatus Paceibacterota bacterium]
MQQVEARYKNECATLLKQNAELRAENDQLRDNIEIMRVDAKENAVSFIQNSEKETIELQHRGLKDDLRKKDTEISGLKTHIIEYEREIAKLREKIKYMKEANVKARVSKTGSESEKKEEEEARLKDTCIVLVPFAKMHHK